MPVPRCHSNKLKNDFNCCSYWIKYFQLTISKLNRSNSSGAALHCMYGQTYITFLTESPSRSNLALKFKEPNVRLRN